MSCSKETKNANQVLDDFGGIELPDLVGHLDFGLEVEKQKNFFQQLFDRFQENLGLRTSFFEVKSEFPLPGNSNAVGAHFVRKSPHFCQHNQNYFKKAFLKDNQPVLFTYCLECGTKKLAPIDNGNPKLYVRPINILGLNGQEKAI